MSTGRNAGVSVVFFIFLKEDLCRSKTGLIPEPATPGENSLSSAFSGVCAGVIIPCGDGICVRITKNSGI